MFIFSKEILKKTIENMEENDLLEMAIILDNYENKFEGEIKFGFETLGKLIQSELYECEEARRTFEPLTHPDNV